MIKASEVREKYLRFFESKGHKRIDSAPLVLENDPTTLFTSSGMQPLVPYLMGEEYKDKDGNVLKRLVDSQPSIRLQDIEEVGDNRHTTFFEMLGNWSLGDYFKEEQLNWFYEFLTKEIGLSKDKLWVSVFEGNEQVSKDTESIEIWKKIGIPEERIRQYGVKKNWWSRSGTPEQMPVGEIGGPDSEVFFDFGEELKLHENSEFAKEECHPNCDCGRFLEIGNSVFMQYKKVGEDKLEELPQKNVDFGGGLERITAAANNDLDVFKTDLFEDLVRQTEKIVGVKYGSNLKNTRSIRIVVEHLRAAAMLISGSVLPGNKTQGYVLRRLLRKALFHLHVLNDFVFKDLELPNLNSLQEKKYPLTLMDTSEVEGIIKDEMIKFMTSLKGGVKILKKSVASGKVDGKLAFDLYQTNGVPLELTLEILQGEGMKFTEKDKKEFEKEFEKHKEQSRTTSAGVFKGGLSDQSPVVIRLHTATHLLLATLRKVLGEHVVQKGQNITPERSRFDFPNPEKLTDEQLKEVENKINEVIKEKLPVGFVVMPKDDALKTGAIHAFNEKYADTVKVYFVGKDLKSAYSKEFCGGPHVGNTNEIGHVRIIKQEKIGSGLIRIYLKTE